MATTKEMLTELLAVQKVSAARIEAMGQTLATLQAAIDRLEAGAADPELVAGVQAALDQAKSNDAALAALTG